MRRARITFQDAFHHCLNRGHGGEKIFPTDKEKSKFLNILAASSKKMKIRILAYCILDNHYHLVLQNTSGRMSDFFKLLNGSYGIYYRNRQGGRGYVFQSRYYSALIQNESYLLQAISYVLSNPIRAGISDDFLSYPWSSGDIYFKKRKSEVIDYLFVEDLFGNADEMCNKIGFWQNNKVMLPVVNTELGPILGNKESVDEMKNKFERRCGRESQERKRKDDSGFEPLAKVYQEVCHMHQVKPEEIDLESRAGQCFRRDLLIHLKDRAGLKYSEIVSLPEFFGLKLNSLGSLYRYQKKKRAGLCKITSTVPNGEGEYHESIDSR